MAAEFKTNTYQKYLLNILYLYKQRQDLKEYLELLLSIIAIGIFIVFAIKPTLVTIGGLFQKISEEQALSDSLTTKINNLGIAQTRFNQNEASIKLLGGTVPDGPDVQGFVRQSEGAIKKENLTVINVGVTQTDLKVSSLAGQTLPLNTTFSVSGNYTNLENFIKDLENLRRPSVLGKMSFQQNANELDLTIMRQAPYRQ